MNAKLVAAAVAVMVLGALGAYGIFAGQGVAAPTAQAAAGRAMVEVALPAQLSATAKLGETAFNARCASCHGVNAAGRAGVAPPLIHKIYEPGHHGDMSFLIAARNGARAHHWRFGDMPPVPGLTDAEIGAIITYVREVQRANGIY
ncbi:cytochrome C [Rhodovulum sp. NI22]|jgi:mono/diheme cytochrome c family protein|nr:cytochrome C [Rhodovulum sp. NI22]